MDKNKFFETIKERVLANLKENDPHLEAVIQNVTKINNICYTGLSFKGSSNVSPIIYLNDFYERYKDDDLSIDDIVERVTSIYQEHSSACHDIDVGGLTDWNTIRERIVPCICNASSCSDYLKDLPHESLCDLSIYYRVLIDIAGNDGEGSVVVISHLMKSWAIPYEQLKEQAWKNIHDINPPTFQTMFEVLSDMMPAFSENAFPEERDCTTTMHVLSSKSRVNGAVYMADVSTLSKIANDLETDLILLPSSRHEILILPYGMADSPEKWEEMKAMVTEINQSTVADEDYLADSCYSYVRSRGTVEKVA